MINNFEFSNIVLTSKNPETFITFESEVTDPCIWYIQPERNDTITTGTVYVNGLDINATDSSAYYDASLGWALMVDFDGDPSMAAFHVYTTDISTFEYRIRFNVYDTLDASSGALSGLSIVYDVSIWNKPHYVTSDTINSYLVSNILTDDESSYLLLRTNPKFTGNVKLMVDTSDNLYLDTFKVSDHLTHKKYRKQQVSANSILSSDIRNVFSTLPIGEMYRVGIEDTLNISIPKTEYKDQFNHEYSYGARLLTDDLYSQNYSILAPIWIFKNLPDYFAIFKLDSIYNEESYDPSAGAIGDYGKKFLTDGALIKSFSFQDTTPLGTYLGSHVNELSQFRAPVFLSLSDPAQLDPDPNTWHGIAIDKGIITGRSEIPFFFDKTTSNFTKMNDFISNGFERNNLLCANLLNMEYIFDDADADLYKMNRYYGLYLTSNPIYEMAYYSDTSMGPVSIISLDGKDIEPFLDSFLFGFSRGDIIDEYTNRIFGLAHETGIARFTAADQIDGTQKQYINEFLSKPDKNIFSAPTEEKTFDRFITLHIDNTLKQGEHLRIINKTRNIIWEVYGIETTILGDGSAWTYASTSDPSTGYPRIYRTAFSIGGDQIEQAYSIEAAFNVFQEYDVMPFSITPKQADNVVSIILDDASALDVFQFQRLTAQTRDIPNDSSTDFNTLASSQDITFFGYYTPQDNDFEIMSFDSLYGPIDFELHGDRRSIAMSFLDTSPWKSNSLAKSYINDFKDPTLYLSSVDAWYKKIQKITISAINILTNGVLSSTEINYLHDPDNLETDSLLVLTNDSIEMINGVWNGYSIYPVNISLLGINQVKDMDFTVYDSSTYNFQSEYWYKRADDVSTYNIVIDDSVNNIADLYPNSYEIIGGDGSLFIDDTDILSYSASPASPQGFNTFYGDPSISINTTTTITFNQLDGSNNYKSYIDNKSEEYIADYYEDPSVRKTLKYGLTIPHVSKWSTLGGDARGHDLRLVLDSSIIDGSTNFIPFQDDFTNEITYPIFKYIAKGVDAWKSYIFNDVNDIISYQDDSDNTVQDTLKNFMFNKPYVDVFSKMVYSNKNTDEGVTRSSIAYFNSFKNEITTIINGLSLSFTVHTQARNLLEEKDWDNYRVSFVSTTSRNNTNNRPMEVIINENTETILIIWYQGSDDLNYNRRFSTEFSGKNMLDGSSNTGGNNYRYFSTDASKSNVKSQFLFRTDSASGIINNTYGMLDIGYDSSASTPFAQFNYNTSAAVSAFNAYGGNSVSGINLFVFSLSYDTLHDYVDYNYIINTNSFSTLSYNWSYKYYTRTNDYLTNTTHLDSLKYIANVNNIMYYILRDDQIIDNNTFSTIPINISIKEPRFYQPPDTSTGIYMYNGWFKPVFYDIFKFNSNETTDIVSIFQKDFVLNNTSFKSYENIPQYWYNKVTTTVTSLDVSTADAINYIENYNPFKSLWDADYFILDSSLVDGVAATQENPSFFGSKLINLPNELDINKWNSPSIDSIDGVKHTLTFNLTRGIINLFKTNLEFIDNWAGLGDAAVESQDGYIKDTIINYYNISIPKITVHMWTMLYDSTRLHAENDDILFEENESKNLEGTLNYVNGEYIYTILTESIPDLSYFISFTLIEK